jgi:hypothetical protein
MLKRVIGCTLLLGLVGILILGAINRTMAKTTEYRVSSGGSRRGQNQEIPSEAVFEPSTDNPGNGSLRGKQTSGNYGQGGGGNGTSAGGGYGKRGDTSGSANGVGQAEVNGWITLKGTVQSVDTQSLVIVDSQGAQVEIVNRAWDFAQQAGFSAQVGNTLIITGFYEGEDFETGQIENLATGQSVALRDENGRPLWAGRGRWG